MSTNHNAAKFRAMYGRYLGLKKDAPRIVGAIAVNFFKASFKNQGAKTNGSIKPWKSRGASTSKRKGRKLLIDEGTLSRSPMIKSANTGRVVIGVDAAAAKYAALLNNGGKIPVTLSMRKFFWAMYYQAMGGRTFSVKTKAERNTKANKNLNADASFWRNMALTKKKSITIEARPFIYDSTDLVDDITNDLMKRINKIVNI